MTRPINLYAISRIQDEEAFNTVKRHQSQEADLPKIQNHEIKSLRALSDSFIQSGVSLSDMDGFFYGFHIPQIGKEFDLLKLTDKVCLNIELKSQAVPQEQIVDQLLKNRHYLFHLGKRLNLYAIVTDTMACYRLSLEGELVEVEFEEVVRTVQKCAEGYSETIDDFFKASEYLVSPLNTPERFIQGEYFLTQNQEQIKKEILKKVDEAFLSTYIHITGQPGTGKTLLLYDIAKALSKNGCTIIIHCGKLSEGQRKISRDIKNLDVVSAGDLRASDFSFNRYSFILVDETHRVYASQFEQICDSVSDNNQVCVFSTDPDQVLSIAEKRNDIVNKIRALQLAGEYKLSEKIRTNKELHSFILNMKDLRHKPRVPINYKNVVLNYANTIHEAQELIMYYRSKGYVFINYSKSNWNTSPYSAY